MQSVLRHSIGTGDMDDEAAFDAGVAAALERPEALAARLFALRAEASCCQDLSARRRRGAACRAC